MVITHVEYLRRISAFAFSTFCASASTSALSKA